MLSPPKTNTYAEIAIEIPETDVAMWEEWLLDQEWPFQQSDQTTLNPPSANLVRFTLFLPYEEKEPVLTKIQQEGPAQPLCLYSKIRYENEWQDQWKAFFTARQVGPFVILPSWEENDHKSQPGEITLHLDPGRAFGTGGHPSTRLCLQLLGAHRAHRGISSIFDVGCGCGILAIAALQLYPHSTAVGIDIDEEAIEVSIENAEKNKILERFDVSTKPLDQINKQFDLVLGNLTGPTLIALAQLIAPCVAPNGTLILSGILKEEADQVENAFSAQGMLLQKKETEEEWAALQMSYPQ